MSHEIYAFKGAKKERRVASLFMSSSSADVKPFYAALQAEEFNSGSCGNGGEKILLSTDVSRAHSALQQRGVKDEDVLTFLTNCMQASDAVTLLFL